MASLYDSPLWQFKASTALTMLGAQVGQMLNHANGKLYSNLKNRMNIR